MTRPVALLEKHLLENCINWFRTHLSGTLINPVGAQFPNFPLPQRIQAVLAACEAIRSAIAAWPQETANVYEIFQQLSGTNHEYSQVFKQAILRYRRTRAAYIESLVEKTSDLDLTAMLQRDVSMLDATTAQAWFEQVEPLRIPQLGDFVATKYVESTRQARGTLAERAYDEKFNVLQAPSLFPRDLAYFRGKCEDRGAPVTIAFLDIDDFKRVNTAYTEVKVDRNVLRHFMQAVEAHVYSHGYAYCQGGDEYLALMPSLSKDLALDFLDELRRKVSGLKYPEINETLTVSIGVCIAEPDCPLTDRELLDRANLAKKFAKERGKNCIAAFKGPHMTPEELQVVRPPPGHNPVQQTPS